MLNELTAHFVKLGAQLAPGQILRIDVDDIDLAGRRVPTNGTREVRTVSGATDWPRINLEFELESNGQIARSGKVELRDMGFMDRSNRYYDGDTLRFEKPMITEWFHAMVAPRQHYASR
ncbi:DUF3016 domain-containing protein [Massilia litorea]|uniref:DUF3016 domain-containing protein n=1 Tax=Massilia litorea TaxID=2769491 RepID=UPI001D0D5F42|nr:DUF3016 domain-containing protein [Massilia litorea]